MNDTTDTPGDPRTAALLEPSYYQPVAVYLPTPDGEAARFIPAGAAIVGGDRDQERLLLYWQARSPLEEERTFADRAHIAHGRYWSDRVRDGAMCAPSTSQFCVLPACAVQAIGHYDPREGQIMLDQPETLGQLTEWLSQDQPLAAGDLAGQLRSTSASHRERPLLRRALARSVGTERRALRDLARRHGHDDLIA